MTLGSASFILSADNAQLLATLAQSEAATRKSAQAQAQAIAQASGTSVADVKRAADQMARSQADAARSAEQSAQKIARSHTESSKGFGEVGKSALAMGAAFAGVTLGIEGLKRGLDTVVESTLKAQQAQRTLTAAYRDAAPQFKQFADQQAAALAKTNTEVETGVARMAILQKQYGLTSAEIQRLTKLALDLGGAFGDSDEAIRSVQAAIRGEPEALEKYGIALQQNAIQNSELLTESQRKNFNSLDAVTQARLRYQIILKEGANFEGAAKERVDSTQGSFDKLGRATDELAKVFGTQLVPGLGRVSSAFADAENAIAAYLKRTREAEASGTSLFQRARGIGTDSVTTVLHEEGSVQPVDISGPVLGPSPGDIRAISDQLRAEEEKRQKDIADVRKRARKLEAEAGEDAAHKAHDARVKELDDQINVANAEKEGRLRALDAETKATVDGIKEQARAEKAAADARIAQLQVEEEAAKRAATSRHNDAIANLDAEVKATEDATAENIRNLEIERDHAKRASEDKRDAEIRALDAEKRARDDARIQEDRQLQDSVEQTKRAEDARHQVATRGLDAAATGVSRDKDARLRDLDDEDRQAQRSHDRRLAALQAQGDRVQKNHDAAVRNIADEADRAQKSHDATARTLSDEADAAQRAHDARARALADEADAAQRVHDAAVQALSDEADAAQRVHDTSARALSDEADAAQRVHDETTRGIQAEADAADRAHRDTLDALQAEEDARLKILDTQLKQLDAEGKQADNADRLANLQQKVGDAQKALAQAQGSGDQGAAAAAQQDITGALRSGDPTALANARERFTAAAGQGAEAVKKAQQDLADAQRALLAEQTKENRDAQKQQLQDQQQTIRDEIAGRKQQADTELQVIKDRTEAEKRAADLELQTVKDSTDARKRAADDELTLVKTSVDSRKRAADDELTLVKTSTDARKRAADDELTLVKTSTDARKRAADDELARIKDTTDAQKQAADDELARGKATTDAAKTSADAKFKSEKESLDKRKLAIEDAATHELDEIANRKQAEQDLHDQNVQQAQDQALAEKRAIDDRRLAEDEADQDHRRLVQAQYDDDQRVLHDRYDAEDTGEIPTLRRALAAFQETASARRTAADVLYAAEQQQIQDTYTNEQTGLIPLAHKAAEETAQRFSEMAASVEASAQLQRQSINDTYTNPDGTSGIIDRLRHLKQDADENLALALQSWEKHKEDLVGPDGTITKTFDTAKEQFDRLIKHFQENGGITVNPEINPNAKPGEPGGPLGPRAPGGAGSGGVPEPYRVTFPFDAPYNGPYAGGAAWPGGPPRHRGVDLALPGPDNGRGTPYGAFQAGRVAALIPESQDPAGGNGILIQTKGGLYNYYGHNDRFLVGQGDDVDVGQQIGTLGRSGLDGGMQTHLHYEVRRGINGDPIGQTIDPVPYMTGGTVAADGRAERGDQQTVTFTVFGQRFTIRLPVSVGGMPATGFEDMLARVQSYADARGIPPEAMAAIAINESGTGGNTSKLAREGHNWFGVRAYDDNAIVLDGKDWERYGSDAEGFRDWARMFGQDRYVRRYKETHQPVDFLQSLVDYGYVGPDDPYGGQHWIEANRRIGGFADGGWIDRPSVISDAVTRQPYAIAGEGGRPEWVAPVRDGAVSGDVFNFHGVMPENVLREADRRQHIRDLLRGPRR